jgi:hypothetical protein
MKYKTIWIHEHCTFLYRKKKKHVSMKDFFVQVPNRGCNDAWPSLMSFQEVERGG